MSNVFILLAGVILCWNYSEWTPIFWLYNPSTVSSVDVHWPRPVIHSLKFKNERAYRNSINELRRVNTGELSLRAVCAQEGG